MSAYEPIIKLKEHDVQALNFVPAALAREIAPIFEMLRPPAEKDPELHLIAALDACCSYKQQGVPAVDLTFFKPETFLHDELAAIAGYKNLLQRGRKVIPVISSAVEEMLWTHLPEVVAQHNSGVCFRLQPDDIVNAPGPTLEWLPRRMKTLGVSPTSTSLLLDFGKLGAIETEDIVVASVSLLRAAEKSGMTFRSVTISGSSLVDYVTEAVAEEHSEGAIVRKELGIWLRASALFGWHRSLKLSDYGIVRPGHVDNVPVPDANGKVRYTAGRQTHYFRGCSKRKIEAGTQYTTIAKRVVNSPLYKGPTYSRGDLFLDRVANHGQLSADMGEWIRMDMSHHLVYAARQTRAILQLVEQQQSTIEAIEQFAEAY